MGTQSSVTRVVFMGFGATACVSLSALAKAGIQIAVVVCRFDDLGDGEHSLFATAKNLDLKRVNPVNPNSAEFVAQVEALNADYLVSIQYDRILKPKLIATAKIACINLHFSPLPRLRGCFPTKWAIINNESSGVTLHYIDPGIDTGAIIDQFNVPLDAKETDQTLYSKLQDTATGLFALYVSHIKNQTLPLGKPQSYEQSSYYPKKIPHGGIINWNQPCTQIEQFVRAFTFPPHPYAKSFCGGHELQFLPFADIDSSSQLSPGEFEYSSTEIKVGGSDGALSFTNFIHNRQTIDATAASQLIGIHGRFHENT